MLVVSLLVSSAEEWQAQRLVLLERLLHDARSDIGIERCSLNTPVSPGASPALRAARSPASGPRSGPLDSASPLLPPSVASASGASGTVAADLPGAAPQPPSTFDSCRPYLVYFALVERLQHILKGPRAFQPAAAPSSAAGIEPAWVGRMRERLRCHDQAVLKEVGALLREYEDELLQIRDFQAGPNEAQSTAISRTQPQSTAINLNQAQSAATTRNQAGLSSA